MRCKLSRFSLNEDGVDKVRVAEGCATIGLLGVEMLRLRSA